VPDERVIDLDDPASLAGVGSRRAKPGSAAACRR